MWFQYLGFIDFDFVGCFFVFRFLEEKKKKWLSNVVVQVLMNVFKKDYVVFGDIVQVFLQLVFFERNKVSILCFIVEFMLCYDYKYLKCQWQDVIFELVIEYFR